MLSETKIKAQILRTEYVTPYYSRGFIPSIERRMGKRKGRKGEERKERSGGKGKERVGQERRGLDQIFKTA